MRLCTRPPDKVRGHLRRGQLPAMALQLCGIRYPLLTSLSPFLCMLRAEWPLAVVDASQTTPPEKLQKELEEAVLTVKTCYWYGYCMCVCVAFCFLHAL